MPWAWVTLRRLVRGDGGVFLPFLFSYLIVTVGYVHGALMLAVVYVAVLIGGATAGVPRRGLLRVFGCGVLTALVTMTVFLPGALSSDVTWRTERGILNSDFLSPDLAGIISGVNSQGLAVLAGWWPEGYSPAPILYVAWFLPLLAFVDWRGRRSPARQFRRPARRARLRPGVRARSRATSARCASPSD